MTTSTVLPTTCQNIKSNARCQGTLRAMPWRAAQPTVSSARTPIVGKNTASRILLAAGVKRPNAALTLVPINTAAMKLMKMSGMRPMVKYSRTGVKQRAVPARKLITLFGSSVVNLTSRKSMPNVMLMETSWLQIILGFGKACPPIPVYACTANCSHKILPYTRVNKIVV